MTKARGFVFGGVAAALAVFAAVCAWLGLPAGNDAAAASGLCRSVGADREASVLRADRTGGGGAQCVLDDLPTGYGYGKWPGQLVLTVSPDGEVTQESRQR